MASFNGDQQISALFRAAYLGDLNYLKIVAKDVERKFKGVNLGEAFEKARDEKGRTALHFGALGGRTQVCRYLVKDLNVDVNVRDDTDTTPLHLSIMGDRYQTTVYLLENGANPSAASKKGYTSLHYAAKKDCKKLIQLLISKGADINAMSQSGPPLQIAIAEGKKDAVKFLLNNHADPNANDYSMYSPLQDAILIKSYECVKLLLQAGADPNCCSFGLLPLVIGVVEKESEIIKCLLAAGANPNKCSIHGLTPLEIAAIGSHHEEVLILFPVTTPIAEITDWSPAGLMKYVRTDEAKRKREKKTNEEFLLSKSKGHAAFKREDYIEAIYFYTNCFGLCPSDGTGLSNRSLCWAKLNEGYRALSDAQSCVFLRPDWAKAHYREGVAWKLLKNFAKATNSFLVAWQLDVKNEELESAYYESVNAQAEYDKTRCLDGFEQQLQEAFGEALKISE